MSVSEDGVVAFSSDNDNQLAIADVDAGSSEVRVTLGVSDGGTLTLATTSGLSFVEGVNGQSSMTIEGTVTAINAGLSALAYAPSPDFNGIDQLSLETSDLGNTGTGGSQTDTDTVDIDVQAVNDSPVNTVPEPQSLGEDGALIFSEENNNQLAIADVDAGSLSIYCNDLIAAVKDVSS